uniref:Reverse transcriptase Ty1/copia-type domain-containing protein n=1 Tax=Tanacetum cinerariifolium TaxID=118510 RepID=A0A699IPN7_TANCI|nr:hypothetical protein [Tanacetum cinerariifolium]
MSDGPMRLRDYVMWVLVVQEWSLGFKIWTPDLVITRIRPVFAGRPSGSSDRTPVSAGRILGKFTASTSSKRIPQASNVELSDIHDGLKIFDCPKSDVSSTITKRIHNIHPTSQVHGDINSLVQTRRQVKHKGSSESAFIFYIHDQRRNNHTDFQLCMLSCFLSQEEPTTVAQALADPDWNKKDARGIVCKNKARLVAQGHRQEKGIDYTDAFASVARIEAIRLFLAFASFIGFMVYQMDVKSAFLFGKIAEEYMSHNPEALRAWYERLSTFLLKHGYRRESIDMTLFIKKDSKDIMLVQVYVDDIIFGSTRKTGLQVDQRPDGIFIHQEKYVADILKKFDLDNFKLASTPFEPQKIREKNVHDEPISAHHYRSMIECLMYLTVTRPDIMFAVCAAAKHQLTPKTSNLLSVKRIFKYLTAYPKLGLWYLRDSPFDLEAFSDSDYAGANGDRKSTTGGC